MSERFCDASFATVKNIPLPIDPILPELITSLERKPSLVLKAAPGSGKTTRVPPALLQAVPGEIWVLEPRRLAAKYSAQRVAQELDEPIGKTVGYQFRFENVESPSTRLRFITEGILLRRMQSDPELKNVSALILDEFHERHLMTDAALSVARALQAGPRPDLRIIVMSATLDTAAVSKFLDNAPAFEVPHRPYEVKIHHLPAASDKPLEWLVRDAAIRVLETQDDGDILVFLPGMAEIRRAEQALESALLTPGNRSSAPLILILHGELTREEQDRAIRRADRRKIILSTNVAETSLTIEGVTAVIDSGLHRQATYSWWSGLPTLRTRPISRASAIQRAGRAGRTAPGVCFRLYTLGEFEARPAFETPEIQRADISPTLLDLKSTSLFERPEFRWFESPSETSLTSSWKLLHLLGALEEPSSGAKLTAVGRALARLPVHPRIGRLVIEAKRHGVLDEGVHLAALIAEGRLESRDALDNLRKPLTGHEVQRSRTRLQSAARNLPQTVGASPLASGLTTIEEKLQFSLLTAFPDRVARLKKTPSSVSRGRVGDTELVFSAGGSTTVEATALETDSNGLLLALDVQEDQRMDRMNPNRVNKKIHVRCTSPIREEWLIDLVPSLLEERDELRWDESRKKVVGSSLMTYGELTLSESEIAASPGEASARILAKNALGCDLSELADADPARWTELLSRVAEREAIDMAFARAVLLTQQIKNSADKPAGRLREIILQCTSTRELVERDWPFEILSAYAPELAPRAEQILPTFLTLPSGRKAKIQYALGKPPWVESRLQDFFGMKQVPSILDGSLPLTVHLLAPNHRALQVTQDLAGFWAREYPELRRSLARRYPRHAWPEDPTQKPSVIGRY
ncbi:MAG: ATP-dependent helicase HrpB [Oligoflexia bacterium]|nr:ATP-dependent helicase HrpB [Oligoflexia bacterium]